MDVFQSCSDSRDAVDLCRPQGLFLKPSAKVNISVQLPAGKQPGKSISNGEVTEKLKRLAKPAEFDVLKVSKSTIEFIRFEGELESKWQLPEVVKRLDLSTLKLSGFSEPLKVRAAEAKVEFPTRHAWDSHFRDAKDMNEMKPGERPDTLHIGNLPCSWFSARSRGNGGDDKPDESVFRRVFERFGEVRCVDVPMCDPYRPMMKPHISGINVFSFGQDHLFEGYVQYKEYMGFVKAMDSLRGMKLLHKDGDRMFTASIKVWFDKSKHLSEGSLKRRQTERDKLMALERQRDERDRLRQEEEQRVAEADRLRKERVAAEKAGRRQEREERRKRRGLRKMAAAEAAEMNARIGSEQRKLMQAQRQLEAMRLLDFLFQRLQEKQQKELLHQPLDKPSKNHGKKERKKLGKKERKKESKKERKKESKKQLKSVLAAACVKPAPAPAQLPALAMLGLQQAHLMQMQDPNFASGFASFPGQWFPPNGFPPNGFPPNGFNPTAFPPHNMFGCFPIGYGGRGSFPRGRGFRGRGFRGRGFRHGGWHGSDGRDSQWQAGDSTHSRSRRSRSTSRSRRRNRSKRRRRSDTRSKSRRRSQSRSKSRRRSQSRSKSRRRSRSRSKSRRRSRSRSKSRRRSRSRSKSPRRSQSRSKSPRRSQSRSKSRRRSQSSSRSRSGSRRGSYSRSESRERSHSKSRSRPRSGGSGQESEVVRSQVTAVRRSPRSQRSWSQRRSPATLSRVSSFTFSEDEPSPRSLDNG